MADENRPIFLLTDFGYKDYYVAGMKARILSINPKAIIIDITHAISKWNIMEGAFILWQIISFIPKKGIVVGVVDPGVGTERRAIIIETDKHYFIGPDNGLLYPVSLYDKILSVIDIEIKKLENKVSSTFHGRDVFAPIAAYISLGRDIRIFGKEISWDDINKLSCEKIRISYEKITGSIIYIDEFGNLTTNVSCELIDKWIVNAAEKKLLIMRYKNNRKKLRKVDAFGKLKDGELGIICNSNGLIEIVMKKKKASQKLKLQIGERIQFIKEIA